MAEGGAHHDCDDWMSDAEAALGQRLRVLVRGAVQGVGFRPFVYRLAHDCGLAGFVQNTGNGVTIEIEGARKGEFLSRLRSEAPPLARIATATVEAIPGEGSTLFEVRATESSDAAQTLIPPDAGICRACVVELFTPLDRRRNYPFIACCDCGPRFTMTRQLPYDRAQTAMAAFGLCEPCHAEYTDPGSRRFHAEPTACPTCGPHYDVSVETMALRLRQGQILALKGVGGYHLMADAHNEAAVSRLRARKERSGKPFAVLAQNIASVQAFAHVNAEEALQLQAPSRPIVLLERRNAQLEAISPKLSTIGVMLPSTPIQWLLLHHLAGRPDGLDWIDAPQSAVLVCTSANARGEPLVVDEGDARDRLSAIADTITSHNRAIVVRADDPVMRVIAGAPVYLRRGRGLTPEPIALPDDGPCLVGFGAHLKASVCVLRGKEAFLAQHVGDLDDPETVRFYRETLHHLLSILDVRPEGVACDLHPDFISTHMAHAQGCRVFPVQHHHAHAAACLVENGVTEPALAIVLDGYGYGDDGEAWGGELLFCTTQNMQRVGGLAALLTPGGDRAAREPWRMASAVLHRLGRGETISAQFGEEPLSASIQAMLAMERCGSSSAAGRYFDAAAGLLNVCRRQMFEAEAAMQLEALAKPTMPTEQLFTLKDDVLSLDPLFARLMHMDAQAGASLFHAVLAQGFAALAAQKAQALGLKTVALSGGCMANRLLSEGLCVALRKHGLRPLMHRQAPPGDGGLALGQAWIGRLRMRNA